MLYYVTKDIPIPPQKRGRNSKYVFPDLEIGDSFVVTSKSEIVAARQHYRRKGVKIVSRMQDEVHRIWRYC